MAGDRGRWRTIEHTADLAVEVEAISREALFIAAAEAVVGVMMGAEEGGADPGPGAAGSEGARVDASPSAPELVWREMELEADDRELLLVDWLREILYRAMADPPLFFRTAELETLEATRLAARVGLSNGEQAKRVQRELKGVTYHDLELGQREGGWYARVVFDV